MGPFDGTLEERDGGGAQEKTAEETETLPRETHPFADQNEAALRNPPYERLLIIPNT